MKARAIFILLIILASLIPVYYINKYFQNILRPRESLSKLFLYLLSVFAFILLYTFLIVFVIKLLFPAA